LSRKGGESCVPKGSFRRKHPSYRKDSFCEARFTNSTCLIFECRNRRGGETEGEKRGEKMIRREEGEKSLKTRVSRRCKGIVQL